MSHVRSQVVVACIVPLAIGLVVGVLLASPPEIDDPSKEFRLTVYDRDFLAYDLDWQGQVLLVVTDADRDGVIDRWEYAKNGVTVFRVKDRNNDYKLDHWWKRTGDNEGLVAVDDDYDGHVDQVSQTVTVSKY